MQRINVLFIVPSLGRAGMETRTIHLANSLDKTKFHTCLFAFEQNLAQSDRIDQSHVKFYHSLRKRKVDPLVVRDISRVINYERIDIVQCVSQFSCLMGWLAIKFSDRKPALIPSIHTTLNVSFKQEYQDRFVYQWILRDSDRIIFVCKAQKDFWEAKYSFLHQKNPVVIYNGVDPEYFNPDNVHSGRASLRKSFTVPEDAFVICCVAGFRQEKGHLHLIEAISHLNNHNVYLLLAGEGPLKPEIKNFVTRKGLTDRILFLGNIADVRPVFAASDISVLSSVAVESFSWAMLESMSMGVPVVASDIGGLSEAIISGETGILVKPGDSSMLCEAIRHLIEDRTNLLKMGENARSTITKQFTTQSMTTETEKVFYEIL